MREREFAPGDVIVHSLGDGLYESTWLRGRDGQWRCDDPASPIYGDSVAEDWITGSDGTLVHRATVRPAPAVDLPTADHHFGWLTAPGTILAREGVAGEWFFGEVKIRCSGIDGIDRHKVTEWVPGALVPTSALAILREQPPSTVPKHWYRNRTERFLAAVNKAGEQS